MATYLLTWNPARWAWEDLPECITTVRTQGCYRASWGCGVTRKIHSGDRVFLIKLGDEPRGLIASGWATSGVYEEKHWDRAAKRQVALSIDVEFDVLLDPAADIFPYAWLASGVYAKMNWSPRASGALLSDAVAAQLEKDWARFLNRPAPHANKRPR